MKYIVYPYKMGSESGKIMAQSLNTKRVRQNGRYMPKRRHVIINWGNSNLPNWWKVKEQRDVKVLNEPESVKVASSKLFTFQVLSECNVAIPAWTTDKSKAAEWLENDEGKVVCRKMLNGHSGRGIVISKEVNELVDAPLYTKYIKKTHEFRIHIFRGKVIDYVQKKKRSGVPDRNPYIRSVENGWVFCREGIVIDDRAKKIAIDAVNALNLDFGAVDVILGHDGKMYVLEVNTAIGLQGFTIEAYKKAFEDFLNG